MRARDGALRATTALLLLGVALGSTACRPEGPPPDAPPGDASSPDPAGSPPAATSAPPSTDIWMATLEPSGDSVVLGEPENLTDRPGYDNQPAFLPDGSGFLYTVVDGSGQADIWRFDLADRTARQVTATPESEYSPTPLLDGSGFSAVRVEADSTQRLWRFDMQGGGARPVLEDVAPVGYHAWIDPGTLALFVLGDPPTLQVAVVESGEARIVARDIGRSIQRMPGGGAASFVQTGDEGARIRRWEPVQGDPAGRLSDVAPVAAPGSDDHAWAPDGTLLQSGGSRIFAIPGGPGGAGPATDDAPSRGAGSGAPTPTSEPASPRRVASPWRLAADFASRGLEITRMAVHPDGRSILFVAAPIGD